MRNAPDKNPFKGVSDLLSRAAPAKRSVHFLIYIIDLALVMVFSYLLFLAGNAVVSNSESYKKDYARYEEEITYYQDILIDAHISEYSDRDNHILADEEDLTVKVMISQILLSYEHDNPSSPEFIENPYDKLKQTYAGSFYESAFENASFDNDYISLFFIEYVPNHNENEELVHFNGKDPTSYLISFYKKHNNEYNQLRFIYAAEDDSIPYLRPDMANDIYEFLIRETGYSREVYDNFVSFYSSMLSDCENIVFNAKSYQEGHYPTYLAYRKKVTQATNNTLLISIVLAYYLAVFLPQMIFKDGRTLGRIFLRTAVINTDKSEVELWKVILRSVSSAISCLYIAFFLVLLPPFNGVSLVLYLPYITIGTLDIAFINIIITVFALSAINGIFMLLTHEKRNLVDLIFKTVTVDVTMLDEPDYDEKTEASV